MRRRREDEAGGQEIAELAALADGSLAPERRAALEARVAASLGARRPAGRAAARGRARAERRGRGRGAGGPASAHRGAATCAPRAERRAVSSWSAPLRLPRRGRRDRAGRARLGHLRASGSSAALAPTELAPGAGRGDADEDVLGLADRARRHRTSAPRRRALLRGVAAQRRRRARAGRDVQRGPERHAVGGRVAEGLHDADRHARAGRRRSGLVGREGARRNGRHRRRQPRLQVAAPSTRRTTCWRAR